jgi:membrane protein
MGDAPGAEGARGVGHRLRALRELATSVVRETMRNDLLSYASALAFQVLFALIPVALAAVAVLGYLDLEEAWSEEVRPQLAERLPEDALSVLSRTVESILTEQRMTWLTFGLAFALWQVSGAVRTLMTPLNHIYGDEEERGFVHRMLVSFALALAVAPGLLLAALVFQAAPLLLARAGVEGAGAILLNIARWPVAAALLLGIVWLIVRHAPARRHSISWSGLGSLLVVGAWLGTSLVFGWYATSVADYGSLHAGLASVIVLLTYLYASSLALLIGAQTDACIRALAEDDADAPEADREDGDGGGGEGEGDSGDDDGAGRPRRSAEAARA